MLVLKAALTLAIHLLCLYQASTSQLLENRPSRSRLNTLEMLYENGPRQQSGVGSIYSWIEVLVVFQIALAHELRPKVAQL